MANSFEDDDELNRPFSYLPPNYGAYVGAPGAAGAPPALAPDLGVSGATPAPAAGGPRPEIPALSPWLRSFKSTGELPGLPDFPGFTAPGFRPTTEADVFADPSYGFRLKQGMGAIENSAAGRGVLRTGGTLKNFNDYAQEFASSEFKNVDDRRLGAFDRAYRSALDQYDRLINTGFGTFDRRERLATDTDQRAKEEYDSEYSAWAANELAKKWAAEFGAGLTT